MLPYVLKRSAVAVLVALTVSLITFSMIYLSGDPAVALAGEMAQPITVERHHPGLRAREERGQHDEDDENGDEDACGNVAQARLVWTRGAASFECAAQGCQGVAPPGGAVAW